MYYICILFKCATILFYFILFKNGWNPKNDALKNTLSATSECHVIFFISFFIYCIDSINYFMIRLFFMLFVFFFFEV
ncbi:hypothetical protein Hanom_Chr00s075922g01791141 [Helianthus anomalus]